MGRICFILALFFATAFFVESARAQDRPNIVIIYADDLGYGDVQCYNPERGLIATPNIDRIARQGMRFTDAHSSSGVCSPSRYTLLTGRYHWRSRLQSGIVNLWGPPVIKQNQVTIASLARNQGYRTACIGKWHLGWDWPIEPQSMKLFRAGGYRGKKDITATDEHRKAWKTTFQQSIPGGPITRGFDEYFGTDVPNWPPFCFIEGDRTDGIPSEFGSIDLFQKNLASQQGPALPDWKFEPVLPALADRAVDFINRQSESEKPFLLYMPLTSPHTPIAVNEGWKGKSQLNRYGDFVMETDAMVGKVMKAIEENDLAQNTLIIFTSDNGFAPTAGTAELESKGHFPSGPLRGYKSDCWEGGHRVPFIVRWPGKVEPGTVCDQLIHQADCLKTIAQVLEQKLPDSAGEDSFSLLPLLKGIDEPIRKHAVSCSSRGVPSIREGSWKLILAPGSGGWSKGKSDQPVQLYRLDVDLGETQNLASEHPEQVKKMKEILENFIESGRSTNGSRQANDVPVKRYPIEPKKD